MEGRPWGEEGAQTCPRGILTEDWEAGFHLLTPVLPQLRAALGALNP